MYFYIIMDNFYFVNRNMNFCYYAIKYRLFLVKIFKAPFRNGAFYDLCYGFTSMFGNAPRRLLKNASIFAKKPEVTVISQFFSNKPSEFF